MSSSPRTHVFNSVRVFAAHASSERVVVATTDNVTLKWHAGERVVAPMFANHSPPQSLMSMPMPLSPRGVRRLQQPQPQPQPQQQPPPISSSSSSSSSLSSLATIACGGARLLALSLDGSLLEQVVMMIDD
jgi:hypothetical protein